MGAGSPVSFLGSDGEDGGEVSMSDKEGHCRHTESNGRVKNEKTASHRIFLHEVQVGIRRISVADVA